MDRTTGGPAATGPTRREVLGSAGLLAGGHDTLDQQIGLRRRRRSDMNGFVRHLDMQRVGIGVRIDRDGLDAHFARCLDDAAGDFATIGDQNFTEHAATPKPWGNVLRRSGEKVNQRTDLR